MSSHSKTRHGFTLVELLVVIAIIGILVGMLLPAIQMVREAARRATCLNNIRQVALACHNYQSSNLAFPPGATQITNADGPSFLVDLLPFIDQGNISDSYKGGMTLINLSQNKIPLFLCASATQTNERSNIGGDASATHYFGSMGAAHNTGDSATNVWAIDQSNGVGFTGIFSPLPNGSMNSSFSRKRAKNFDDCGDGSSNTIALFEQSRSSWPNGEALRAGWAFGASTPASSTITTAVYSGITLQFPPNAFVADAAVSTVNGAAIPTTFDTENMVVGSQHPGGLQVAMVDGSARFVNDNVDPTMFRSAATIDDGLNDDF